MMERLSARLRQMMEDAIKQSAGLGHRIGHVELDQGWNAAVATCLSCTLIVAVDLSEEPYIFGRAPKKKCTVGLA